MARKPEVAVLTKGRGTVPLKLDQSVKGELVLSGTLKKAVGESRPVRLVPRGEAAVVRTHLGRNVPPGMHNAKIKTGDGEIDVKVEVPERERLRLSPSRIEIVGKPGGEASAEITAENRGNVATSLQPTGVAGLFASGGVSTAFSAAYGVPGNDPMEIFGAFVLTLRRSYLGLMHVKFAGVETPLEPGERRSVKAEFKIPKPQFEKTQVGKGRRFRTVLLLGGPRLTVRLTIA
jgi:hypothetical protein